MPEKIAEIIDKMLELHVELKQELQCLTTQQARGLGSVSKILRNLKSDMVTQKPEGMSAKYNVSCYRANYTKSVFATPDEIVSIFKDAIGFIFEGGSRAQLEERYLNEGKTESFIDVLNCVPINIIRTRFMHTAVMRMSMSTILSKIEANVLLGRHQNSLTSRNLTATQLPDRLLTAFILYNLFKHNEPKTAHRVALSYFKGTFPSKYIKDNILESDYRVYLKDAVEDCYEYLNVTIKEV